MRSSIGVNQHGRVQDGTFFLLAARGRDALLRHYEIECELADRLRAAAPAERKELYRRVYDELFSRVPDHPQNTRKYDPALQAARTARQLRFLDRFLKPDSVYLEVGPGDCHLARTIALRVGRVYAVDVSELIAGTDDPPANFRLIVSDGVTIDVPPGSVHVAYSNQLMEHLHPDDASEQLGEIYRALAPGGVYVCVTPHRYSGPHDISQYFDAEARGFHLKEYSYRELRDLFRAAGFVADESLGGVQRALPTLTGMAGSGSREHTRPLAGPHQKNIGPITPGSDGLRHRDHHRPEGKRMTRPSRGSVLASFRTGESDRELYES